MNLTIATLGVDDVEGFIDTIQSAWYATYPNAEYGIRLSELEYHFEITSPKEQAVVGWRDWLSSPPTDDFIVLVARTDGIVVGICTIIRHPDHNELEGMYIRPEHQRRGIGTALWQAAQAYMDPAQPTLVRVVTYTPAVKFYEYLGFIDTGRRIQDSQFKFKSGVTFPEIEMRREVGS